MLKLQILQVSPTKEAPLRTLEAEYEKRLQAFVKLETITVPACKKDDRAQAQKEEAEALENHLDPHALLVVLDERGQAMTSEEFAKWLGKVRDFGEGKVQFLIGGSHGLDPALMDKAKLKLAFSKMTFTHEMIRVFLKEQLYRACAILAGKTYHK